MKLSKHKRWNASRKTEVALALLKGESLEEVSRMTGQPAHVLTGWKAAFLQGHLPGWRVGQREGIGGREHVIEDQGGGAGHGQRPAV